MRTRRTTALLIALGLFSAAPIAARAQNGPEPMHAAQYTFISPVEVEPGGTINGHAGKAHGCPGKLITSPGFAEPMRLMMQMPGVWFGSTTVIKTPGTYTATKFCDDSTVTQTAKFTIKGTPPTTPPTTKPPGKPKPPVVKPRGAADTGDGSTA